MRIGITGANGFIGAHLLRSAVARSTGAKVDLPVAFLQRGSPMAPIHDLDGQYEKVEGDLLDRSSLDRFVSRCDAVFHLAGFNRYWALDSAIFHQTNCVGARNMAEACLQKGIRKLVHVSSCITLGASDTPIPRTEESSYNLSDLRFLYGETKKAGEDEMKRWAAKGLPVVIVNPASAIGEQDHGPTPIGKPIRDIARGMWPVYVAGGACFIDVHDVVRGLWLALERGRTGEQYLLAGENLSNKQFMSAVAESAGVAQPRVRVPTLLLGAVGHVAEWLADRVTRKHPPLTAGMSGLIGKFLYFDGLKAETELGFKAGPCASAIERSVRWFRTAGNCRGFE